MAPTPKVTANKIENNPYKIGISMENFLINIDNGFKLLTSKVVELDFVLQKKFHMQ